MSERGITQMIVSDPMSIFYLTGVYVQPFERLFCLYIPAQGTGTLFLNKLFNVSGSGLNEVWMSDTDDGVSMISDVIDSKLPLGIDKSWPAGFLLPLIEKNPGMRCVLASNCIDDARACKDEYECDKMREASKINDMCMDHMFFFIKAGMTELECADEVLRF